MSGTESQKLANGFEIVSIFLEIK